MAEQEIKAEKHNNWDWNVKIESWIGRECRLETDRILKTGIITGLAFTVLDVGECIVRLPRTIELDGDDANTIEFSELKRFRFTSVV